MRVAAALASLPIVLMACGGGGGTREQAQTPAPAAAKISSGPSADAGASSTSAGAAASPVVGNRPLAASAMAGELQKLGLEAGKLPQLGKMEPDKLRQVMKTFNKALGVKCSGCHDPNDFRAPTPNKKVASRMWDEYVRRLAFEDGSLVYCDSCHQGQATFLDRHDKKMLGDWMDANFVSGLRRDENEKKTLECSSCHGEEMEMRFLATWRK